MATFGICHLTLIPLRNEPAERSEMVSQLLFGETVEVLKTKGSWSLIKSHFDDYKGWITAKMLTLMSEGELTDYQSAKKVYVKDAICRIIEKDANLPVSYLAGGSTLLEVKNRLMLGNHILELDHQTELYHQGDRVDIVGTALKFLNTPYLWGGRTAFGIDCSGFTQVVFKMNGMVLPRDAHQQSELGNMVHNVENALPGDLAFFENEKGRITHTGIILKNSEIIHSSGKVHIDRIDQRGIFSIERQEYTHKLVRIKRFL